MVLIALSENPVYKKVHLACSQTQVIFFGQISILRFAALIASAESGPSTEGALKERLVE